MYYICLHDGTIHKNLTSEQVNEFKNNSEWYYIGTMEGLEIEEKIKKLKKCERLK